MAVKSRLILSFLCLLPFLAMSHQSSDIANSPEQVSPLLNGQFVPDVVLKTEFGRDIRLLDLVESQPSVILFYRGGWCPYCNRQMQGLMEVEQQIIDLGYQIIAISPDTPARLQQQKTATDFDVVRLSDSAISATSQFGLGYALSPETAATYRNKFGATLTKQDGTSQVVLPVPAAFIVDTSGVILFQYANPNHKVRIDPQLLYYAARLAKIK